MDLGAVPTQAWLHLTRITWCIHGWWTAECCDRAISCEFQDFLSFPVNAFSFIAHVLLEGRKMLVLSDCKSVTESEERRPLSSLILSSLASLPAPAVGVPR